MRLASGIGSGGSSIVHACRVGEIFGSDVFQRRELWNISPRFQDLCTNIWDDWIKTFLNALDYSIGCSSLVLWLSTRRAGQPESRVHRAAHRSGLSMGLQLSYFEIPLCTDQDEGTVELLSWPFLLPSTLVTWADSDLGYTPYWKTSVVQHASSKHTYILVIPLVYLLPGTDNDWPWVSISADWQSWSPARLLGSAAPGLSWSPGAGSGITVYPIDIIWCFTLVLVCLMPISVFLLFIKKSKIKKPVFSILGDEGNALGSSWMTYHWQPDLSPVLTTSACSRFLITTVPSSMSLDNREYTYEYHLHSPLIFL